MRPTLPRGKRFFRPIFGVLLTACAACHHADPPVAPGSPLPAEPDIEVGSMDDECNGLTSALATYGACPNMDDDDRSWVKRTIEVAEDSFEAGKKGKPDTESQRAIALACHRAAVSVQFATQRCLAGPRPKVDD